MTPQGKSQAQEARQRLAALAAQPEASIDLAHAALLIAAEEQPGLDVERYRALLLELGVTARERVARAQGSAIKALNRFVFEELGFVGNHENYYEPSNSLLHEVLKRRRGIPITLSLVYIDVGRRAGLAIEGVGLPGHFIVRAQAMTDAGAETALVDPFNGKIIDEDECQQRLDGMYGGQAPLTEEMLRPARPREILVRLLRNLKAIYAQSQLYRRALAITDRILLFAPDAHHERRDRGALLAQLGHYAAGITEIETYLQRAPQAPDAERVREQLKKLRLQMAMLN
ncbi:MAG: tetratricopeptide repeat protein [Acidobacteriota bacterium]|nr:tetratricopeptide repeat protein [Acidobacteriota bacterium]